MKYNLQSLQQHLICSSKWLHYSDLTVILNISGIKKICRSPLNRPLTFDPQLSSSPPPLSTTPGLPHTHTLTTRHHRWTSFRKPRGATRENLQRDSQTMTHRDLSHRLQPNLGNEAWRLGTWGQVSPTG